MWAFVGVAGNEADSLVTRGPATCIQMDLDVSSLPARWRNEADISRYIVKGCRRMYPNVSGCTGPSWKVAEMRPIRPDTFKYMVIRA